MGGEPSSVLLMRILFKILGILKLEKWKSFGTIWTAFVFVGNFSLPIASFHYLIYQPVPMLDKLQTLVYFSAAFHIISNQAILIKNRTTLEGLFKEIEDLHAQLYEYERNQKILRKWARRGTLQCYFFIGTYAVYTFGIATIGILQMVLFQDYKPPFLISTPFSPQDDIIFIYLFQTFSLFISTFTMATQLGFICIIGTSIAGFMNVLKHELLMRGTAGDSREKHIFIYKLHSKIINVTASFNNLYGFSLALLTALSSVQSCVATYPLAMPGFTIQNVILFCTTNVFPAAICETGNAVITESNEAFWAAYDNDWYTTDVKSRKELATLILAASRPVQLHYKYVVKFTYATYLSILQTSYSYMAMLRTMDIS